MYDTPGADTQIGALRDFVVNDNPYTDVDESEGDVGVDFVTLSIGGNDFGFSGIIINCLSTLTSCANEPGQFSILTQVYDGYADLRGSTRPRCDRPPLGQASTSLATPTWSRLRQRRVVRLTFPVPVCR